MHLLGPVIVNALVLVVFLIYFSSNKENALRALKLAWKSFKIILPLVLIILFAMVFIQKIFTLEFITKYILSISGSFGYFMSAVIGSFFHIPHFIAFPIGGQLLQSGVKPGVIGVFITSLVMVHVFTMPIEIKELGFKFALARNLLSFIFAIIIGALIGVFY